ncbi:hypothetical protein, partial [Klebsiella pneumoniae]|uniref:hypothetical protein n=1 Tax=Klebsiella pneumoniae TaxID=573 RepID=UPI00200DCE51
SPFLHLISTQYLTWTGKVLAETPGSMGTGNDPQALRVRAQMMQSIKWHRGLVVSAKIRPALHVINTEHFVPIRELEFLVRDNPFVPRGREAIF